MNADELARCLAEYRLKAVVPDKIDELHQPGIRAYEKPDNAENEVYLPPRTKLATVVNLTNLGRALKAGRRPFRIPQFDRLDTANALNVVEINRLFQDYLRSESRKRDFLKAFLRAWRLHYRREDPLLRCTWAADWNTLKTFLDKENPQRWLRAVGVSIEQPAWIAVFRYSVAELNRRGIRLFRPTQLDAGWNANHFPSPPQAELKTGGHTMFLGVDHDGPNGYGLVNEYLHAHLDFSIRHWDAAGGLVAEAGRDLGDLTKQRAAHRALLEREYGAGVNEWMSADD